MSKECQFGCIFDGDRLMGDCRIPWSKECVMNRNFDVEEKTFDDDKEYDDYKDVKLRNWIEYEFATIEYDYSLHPEAARRIRLLFDRLETGE